MSDIALDVRNVSIDYKNLMHMSLHRVCLKRALKGRIQSGR